MYRLAYSIYKKPVVAAVVETMVDEDLSIDVASIENFEPLFQTVASNQCDSISQLYTSLVNASHENEDNEA